MKTKRYLIEKNKNGVAIWDNINKVYLIDASTIQEDNNFTISKKFTIQKNRNKFKWLNSYYFDVLEGEKK